MTGGSWRGAILTLGVAVAVAAAALVSLPGPLGADEPSVTTADMVRLPTGPEDYRFRPADITVTVGATVRFVNQEDVFHTVTFNDGSFDQSVGKKGEAITYTATAPGNHPFFCAVHVGMEGVLAVVPPPPPPPSSSRVWAIAGGMVVLGLAAGVLLRRSRPRPNG